MADTTKATTESGQASSPWNAGEWARRMREQLATVTGGLAPDVYVSAWWDWYLNLAKNQPKQLEIMQHALASIISNWNFAVRGAAGEPLPPEKERGMFVTDGWHHWPFNVIANCFGNNAEWWRKAWADVPGVPPDTERTLKFVATNALELFSPANYLATNPELLEATRAESGQNLVRGFSHWLEDISRTLSKGAPSSGDGFVVGKNIATTPGKVALRNDLVELIQYSPTTDKVFAEPILIVSAWIMKYYILDLSEKNSLVRYLVSKGHTVFIVSWKNPNESDRHLGMDDYLRLGINASVDTISHVLPGQRIHSVGYCIGGTLMSIGAASLAAAGDQRLKSLTLLAGQQDFSEPGELSVFISPSQLDMLEAVMARPGLLKSEQMGGAFALLRSRDLLWTPAVNSYLRGNRETPNDLMAWNTDGTRMPCRMHSEYLRGLYLENSLARGTFLANGRVVDLASIKVPMFVVGTETDHVAPWKSVYKARGLTRSEDYTFLLTSGGHNAGIVSGAVHLRRRHRVRTWLNDTDTLPPDVWCETTETQPGSWWPCWQDWLDRHSTPDKIAPPPLGSSAAGYAPITDAPGEYVLQK